MSNTIKLIAKELEKDDITLVIFDCDKKVFESSGEGLESLIDFLESDEGHLERYYNLSWGDKVIGKAAALLIILLKPKEVFGKLLSEAAASTFTKFGIPFEYEEKTPYILNIKRDNMCPFERRIKDIDDLILGYRVLKSFLGQFK